jgi:hypothetical protein
MEPPVLPPVIPPVLPPTVSPPEVLVTPPRSFCVRTPDEMLPLCAALSDAAPKVSARAMPKAQAFVIRSVICSSSTGVCDACPAGGSGWGIWPPDRRGRLRITMCVAATRERGTCRAARPRAHGMWSKMRRIA